MIDIANVQGVGSGGESVVVLMPLRRMTKEQALVHAAWLVAIADESPDNAAFKQILEQVQNT